MTISEMHILASVLVLNCVVFLLVLALWIFLMKRDRLISEILTLLKGIEGDPDEIDEDKIVISETEKKKARREDKKIPKNKEFYF